ncbi:DUF3788 domain-containing protein [Clostridioides difficile]|nr:DUF3788 domain-containing protein [Clostridioides difficile]MDN9299484.1 DUF3788 family protein [Clostridioides difficile]MDV9262299.1 DUF3788 domain-containing protein [Clostridioides difficile]
MYERMLDKSNKPCLSQIIEYIGKDGYARLCKLKTYLETQYNLSRELRFPFGNNYGWGYKYSHKSFHLFYAFFEKGAFTVLIQIGDKQVPAVEKTLVSLTPKAKELWVTRYTCGNNGGWIKYRILEDADLLDIIQYIRAKKSPPKQN